MTTPDADARPRNPLLWLVALAAVLLIAAGVFWSLRPEDPAPPTSDKPTVTTLQAPGEATYDARCMVPNADTLRRAEVAFRGTVTQLSDAEAVLEVTEWFAGDETDQVTVQAPGSGLSMLLSAVEFTEGGDFLVAATGGRVMICGFSDAYDAELAALYDQAFAS